MDRYNNNRNNNYRGRGGGYKGRYNNRHQPYGRGSSGRGGSFRGGGGGRGSYNSGGGRQYNNRPSHPSNRFDAGNTIHSSNSPYKRQEKESDKMMKQLSSMVARMGDLITCAAAADKNHQLNGDDVQQKETNSAEMRGVVTVISQNIQELTTLLCDVKNAPLFLKYKEMDTTIIDAIQDPSMTTVSTDEILATDEAGPLATLVTSCAATLPLSSPSYCGLTFSIEELAPDQDDLSSRIVVDSVSSTSSSAAATATNTTYKGFAKRCVDLACKRLGADLDLLCGLQVCESSSNTMGDNMNGTYKSSDEDTSFVDAFMRCKLLLRYFALLARTGIVKGFSTDDETTQVGQDQDLSSSLTHLSVFKLLQILSQCATNAVQIAETLSKHGTTTSPSSELKATSQAYKNASILLSILVLSTISYTLEYIPQSNVNDILNTLDQNVLKQYVSPYQPGVGWMALLLDQEQMEERIGDGNDPNEDEDDDSDDDNEDASTPVCADTLQDLLRTTRTIVDKYYQQQSHHASSTRFALLTDAPWLGLKGKEQAYAPMEGDDEDEAAKRKGTTRALDYSGEGHYITISSNCRLIPYLVQLGPNTMQDLLGFESVFSTMILRSYSLEGVIFGRVSIFDAPTDEEDDDDDDEENEMSNGADKNLNLNAYSKTFSLIDRYFLIESVRDCLICHRSKVSETGIAIGSCREIAEQVWAVSHLFLPASTSTQLSTVEGAIGIEYGIVEAILSLILQAPRGNESSSPLTHTYLSRVLLELTKYQPLCVPQSLSLAVSVLFNDFVPTLSPIAKGNFSSWLAFHLTNTDYQWPHAYWNMWAPYVTEGMSSIEAAGESLKLKRNSRGEFVAQVLQHMSSGLYSPESLVTDCLPAQSPLAKFVLNPTLALDKNAVNESSGSEALVSAETDLMKRIWDNNDDPESIIDYIVGDELSEMIQGALDYDTENISTEKLWCRTGLVMRSILHPLSRDRQRVENSLSKIETLDQTSNQEENMIMMEDNEWEDDGREDVIRDILAKASKYKSLVLAVLAKDINVHEENLDLRGESKVNEGDMLLMGERYILKLCEKSASTSVLLEAIIDILVKSQIVSEKCVLTWVLGANDSLGNAKSNDISGWWNIASCVIRSSVTRILSNDVVQLGSDGIGMIIDSVGEEGMGDNATTSFNRRMNKVTDGIIPLVQLVTNSIDKILSDLGTTGKGGKIYHAEADLKEGLKYVIRDTYNFIISQLKNDEVVIKSIAEDVSSSTEIENWVAKCDLFSALFSGN